MFYRENADIDAEKAVGEKRYMVSLDSLNLDYYSESFTEKG